MRAEGGEGFYAAYFRDLDGNKLDVFQIFVSDRPASLLVFDGDPVMAPVAGTSLTFAVNTNWDIFFDAETSGWFWLNDGAWLRAAAVKGPWEPAGALPSAFTRLPDDSNFFCRTPANARAKPFRQPICRRYLLPPHLPK